MGWFSPKPKPLSPQYAIVGEEVLNIISELRKDAADLKQRPVQTSFEGDHEELDALAKEVSRINEWINSFGMDIKQIKIDVKNLENKSISTRIRSVLAPKAWQRPRDNLGRFAKRNGAGDDAR